MPTPPPHPDPSHDAHCEIDRGDIHCHCHERGHRHRQFPALPGARPTPSRYQFRFRDADFDVYRLAEIVGIRHHAQFHAFKKIIRAGQSLKSIDQDIDEAIAALARWKEMLNEDRPVQLRQAYDK